MNIEGRWIAIPSWATNCRPVVYIVEETGEAACTIVFEANTVEKVDKREKGVKRRLERMR